MFVCVDWLRGKDELIRKDIAKSVLPPYETYIMKERGEERSCKSYLSISTTCLEIKGVKMT